MRLVMKTEARTNIISSSEVPFVAAVAIARKCEVQQVFRDVLTIEEPLPPPLEAFQKNLPGFRDTGFTRVDRETTDDN